MITSSTPFFEQYLTRMTARLADVRHDDLESAAKLFVSSATRGGKIIVAGNGGSAAMASHVAVDLTKTAHVRSVTFNEADLITCLANDYGYESWVAKALEFYADRDDVVVLISSSGRSPNIVNAARQARAMALPVVTFSGFDRANALRHAGDVNFWVDSTEYNIVEMVHHVWLVSIIDRIIDIRRTS